MVASVSTYERQATVVIREAENEYNARYDHIIDITTACPEYPEHPLHLVRCFFPDEVAQIEFGMAKLVFRLCEMHDTYRAERGLPPCGCVDEIRRRYGTVVPWHPRPERGTAW